MTEPLSAGYRIRRSVISVKQAQAGYWLRGDVMKVRLEIQATAARRHPHRGICSAAEQQWLLSPVRNPDGSPLCPLHSQDLAQWPHHHCQPMISAKPDDKQMSGYDDKATKCRFRYRLRAWIGWCLLALLIALTSAHRLTKGPGMPRFDAVQKGWQPSEGWLYDRSGTLLDSERVQFDRRWLAWVPLDAISKAVRDTVVQSEDQRFWNHSGVDWIAIASAAKVRWNGGRSRGASTIPMQLAAYLAPELAQPGQRNWLVKIRQMRSARALASDWTHEQMLEAYFNLLPLRGELLGIGAGAHLLFGKSPAELNRMDATLFVALLPTPSATSDHWPAAPAASRKHKIAVRSAPQPPRCCQENWR